MTEIDRLSAVDGIRQLKAQYFRGVDTCDGALVKAILAEDCVLDYMRCCTDPATGTDFLPAMNVILHGRESWRADGMAKFGIVSVHRGPRSQRRAFGTKVRASFISSYRTYGARRV